MIGDKIKEFRKKKKLTQVELGKEIGVQGATVTRYENGVITPTYETIQKIADILKVPISEFLSDEQLKIRKMNAANNALITILETIFDTVDVNWKCTVDGDGVPEYDGDYTVELSKKGEEGITLTKKEWESLFLLVCQNIPAFIKLISDYEHE